MQNDYGGEADYVIVGGGSAGCVLAARLSEDPSVTVFLLEAGPAAAGLYAHMPAGTVKLMASRETNWMYMTEPDASIGGRRVMWHAGRMLGGGSAINGMVYIRGARHDYDRWAELGCTGWSWDEVLPYFQRSECFEGDPPPSHRGPGGPLSVARSRNPHPLVGAFVAACTQTGMPYLADYCAGDTDGVFENFVTQRRGRRSSTALSFLAKAAGRANLRVVTEAMADRVLIEDGRAAGVVFRRGGEEQRIRARREVLLSAGTMQSPLLLMRSGIGPAAALRALGIAVTADLPVGRNLHEHASFATTRTVNVPTFNTMAGRARLPLHFLRYALRGSGLLSTAPVLAMANFRSGPEAREPDLKISLSPNCIDMAKMKPAEHPGMTIFANVSPPRSRGEIRLKSADPADRPVIDYQHLGDPSDMAKMIIAAKRVDAIFRAPALAEYVTGMFAPARPPADDAEWEDLIRARVGIGFHPVGTCRMGVGEAAVVDPTLRVRGVIGLRVIDASIMPIMPNANTNAPAIMVAEKGADLVRRG